MAVPAKVVHILGRMGSKGVTRVRCKIISERGRDKILIRNVIGPIRIGDILMIQEAEMEAADVIR